MSGLLNTLHELHQQHKERHEERREARQQRHGHGGHHNDSEPDNYGSQPPHQRPDDDARRTQPYPPQGQVHGYAPPLNPPPSSRGPAGFAPRDEDDSRRAQPYPSQGEGQGYGYAPPSGPPPSSRGPSGFASQGGLDRGDFASDADIARMVATGELEGGPGPRDDAYGPAGANLGRRNAYGRHDAPTVPHSGQGYGERVNEYGRYDAPAGPPPGQAYQGQESYQQGYGSNLPSTYGPSQTQGRTQYDAPQGPPVGYGRSPGNAPASEFSTSRNAEERYGSGYGGPTGDRGEHQYRGEAASYYNQQSAPGQGDRYAHLAGMAQEHGDDPEMYRRATQGLQERIQMQAQSHPRRDDEDGYKTHVDAHRKAYGDGDKGPMDADTIGSAAAMEAFKQTVAAAKSSNAPAGAFQGGKTSGGPTSKPGKAAQDEEEEEAAAARGGGGGGLQDKLMALAMSHAGKLFDKNNAGRPGGADKSQDKAQAMQSAAATAMELFKQYQTKGRLDASDMSKVMGLAMNLF